MYPLVSYLENPLLCTENNPTNIYYLLNTNIFMALVTHLNQFYTLQMTRCDNIFDSLYCNEERTAFNFKVFHLL